MPPTHQLQPGQSVDLAAIDTRAAAYYSGNRETAKAEFRSLRDQFIDIQAVLYAENKQKLLIVLQAMDAGGKDGTIRNITKGVNPQGVRVISFKVPSKEEMAHDFLWRIHKAVPAEGVIGIFNRSHYEDVLVVRVHNYVPEAVWRPRYEQINHFEKLLADTETTILKFYLHISPQEQKERFQARLDDPSKHWKFSLEDLEKRKFWGDYMAAYDEMLERCTTAAAPWHVIPADQKWYRNLAIMRIIIATLQKMNPQYPAPEEDIEGVVIE